MAPNMAVALSGGPDSTALAMLTARWCSFGLCPLDSKRGGTSFGPESAQRLCPWGFVVDHRLRPESSTEAAHVAKASQQIGLQPVVLTCDWSDAESPARGKKMAAARSARYSLLAHACQERRVHSLLVAHHAGDQAETFLMRLSRASGLQGLACMAEISVMHEGGAR
eukprot:CAMPEP_0117663524 /NCGR_PEP_ID=MMETSP0804-20121206/8660_1 /TAXON_ID=1074897 /ORGANISM="Tetraselmis astigmatica, Strain CCMP880" /LENGTH=166 /DNA_ID=CAMNT_0005470551 /DNA_START=739 /DNA_END=1238 /DNA_ORIENTATION=-